MIARTRVILDFPLDHVPVEPDWNGRTLSNLDEVSESRIEAARVAEKSISAKLKEVYGDQLVEVIIEEVRDE